jgi:hypothetical protein
MRSGAVEGEELEKLLAPIRENRKAQSQRFRRPRISDAAE